MNNNSSVILEENEKIICIKKYNEDDENDQAILAFDYDVHDGNDIAATLLTEGGEIQLHINQLKHFTQS